MPCLSEYVYTWSPKYAMFEMSFVSFGVAVRPICPAELK